MSLITSPFKAYVRWRHSRGFGVHSPFAYRIVKMAVSPGDYGYYGYAAIDDVILSPGFKGYPNAREDARLLLRLLVQLGSRRLILPAGLPTMCAAAVGAGVEYVCYDGCLIPEVAPGDLIVGIGQDKALASRLVERVMKGSAALVLHPDGELSESLYRACGRGLIFHGVRLLLVVPREEMAFVAYTMKF